MDFLNKAFTQFNDLFRSMTPGGRITAGLLLVVAVVSVGYLFQSQVSGGDDYLFSGDSIPTPTLHKMEGAFGKANLNGYTIEGGRVKVPRAQRAAYLAALVDAKALPPNFADLLRDSESSNPFDSPKVREERGRLRKQEAMSMVLSCLPRIESAHVIIDQQPRSEGFDLTPLKTASVEVSAIGGVPLDDEQVEKICYYVKGAIAGMKAENVMIVDANGPVRVWREEDSGGIGNSYAREVRKVEQALTANIRKALAYIPNVTVVSAVTLDHEKGSHSVEIKTDPKTVPVRTMENTTTSTHESVSSGGVPGLIGQGGGAMQGASLGGGAPLGSGKGNETNESTKTEQVNVVSQTTTEKETFGPIPKTAKVSVGIPVSYYENVWKRRNPVKEGEEAKPDKDAIEKIQKEIELEVQTAVANLLPPVPDVKDATSLVHVTTFQDLKAVEIQAPAVTQRALSWLGQSWPMLAMVGLVLFSLGMLRSMLRSVPAPSTESATVSMRVTAPESKPQESEEPVEATAARRLRRMTGSGPSLRDELSELVKEDPDSAANILRSWIGQVN